MASRQRGLQGVPVSPRLRPVSEQQRPGVRVPGPLLRSAAPPQGQRRPPEGKVHAGVRLGHLPAVFRSTGW